MRRGDRAAAFDADDRGAVRILVNVEDADEDQAERGDEAEDAVRPLRRALVGAEDVALVTQRARSSIAAARNSPSIRIPSRAFERPVETSTSTVARWRRSSAAMSVSRASLSCVSASTSSSGVARPDAYRASMTVSADDAALSRSFGAGEGGLRGLEAERGLGRFELRLTARALFAGMRGGEIGARRIDLRADGRLEDRDGHRHHRSRLAARHGQVVEIAAREAIRRAGVDTDARKPAGARGVDTMIARLDVGHRSGDVGTRLLRAFDRFAEVVVDGGEQRRRHASICETSMPAIIVRRTRSIWRRASAIVRIVSAAWRRTFARVSSIDGRTPFSTSAFAIAAKRVRCFTAVRFDTTMF